MRDELTDHEWAAIGPMLEAARSSTGEPLRVGERPSRSQWHLLGVAIWSTLARSARQFRSLYHLLQPFVRWRRAGVWSRIMNALAMTHDTARTNNGRAGFKVPVIGLKMPNRLRWGPPRQEPLARLKTDFAKFADREPRARCSSRISTDDVIRVGNTHSPIGTPPRYLFPCNPSSSRSRSGSRPRRRECRQRPHRRSYIL
jgi:transposase